MNARTDTVVPVIIGTAGHVDHGKTSLVQMLTGCDTDRLKEEKLRGLTIDLGFAPCRFPGHRLAGIVDVPGHRDFIRNMVAGAASIDVLLLVVAADDGVMPQTREHLQIVGLLRTPRVLVTLTKIDLVDPEMLALVREDLAAFLVEVGYPDAPILPVSNRTGEGVAEVRRELETLVATVERQPDERAFRLFVERRFSVPGHGTVVTGIPASGTLHPGDQVALHPPGSLHGVRSIQNYKQDSEVARPGICAAINLRDCDQSALTRGHCIADPTAYAPEREVLVTVRNVSPLPWRSNRVLRCHCGTASVGASLRLLADEVPAGHEGFARLILDHPLVVVAGDRFVLRNTTPDATVGGGRILSVRGQGVRRGDADLAPRLLAARDTVDENAFLAELLVGSDAVLHRQELVRLTRQPAMMAAATIAAAIAAGHLSSLGPEACLVTSRAAELLGPLGKRVARYHDHHPLAWGMDPAAASEACGLPVTAAADLLRLVARDPTLAKRHGRIAQADHQPRLTAKQIAAYAGLLGAVDEAGVNGLAPGPARERIGISQEDFKLLGQLLVDEGRAVRLGQHLLSHTIIDDCRRAVLDHFGSTDQLTVAAFRTATGTSRNLAIPLLELFDGEGLMVRNGEARILRQVHRDGT